MMSIIELIIRGLVGAVLIYIGVSGSFHAASVVGGVLLGMCLYDIIGRILDYFNFR